MGEVHSPYNLPVIDSYRVVWGMCPRCKKKMFKIACKGLLPLWETMKCPFCLCVIIPIALEKPKTMEDTDSCFNPSQRRIKIEQGKTY